MTGALDRTRALVEAAQGRVSLEALAGRATVLVKGRGECPLPGCRAVAKPGQAGGTVGRKRRKKALRSAPFEVRGDRFRCHKCEESGDVVDLERLLRGGTIHEAAKRLAGMVDLPPPAPKPVRARREADRNESAARIAAGIWREAKPAAGTLVETYLAARGIVRAVLDAALGQLRFHPAAKWFWDDGARRWATAPAMVALVVVAGTDGRPIATGGVHCTYLAACGTAKAEHDEAPSKLMWGPQGLDGRPGGTWLIGPSLDGFAGDGLACGAEGIESALSLSSLIWLKTGSVTRCWAALSLDRLQGRLARDADRCVDLAALTPDPARPAFVWPGIQRVRIGVDRDMSPVQVRARTGRGKPVEMELGAEARARLCARMAVAAWTAAGAVEARAVAPPPGMDFNDELRRVLRKVSA